MRFFFLNHKLTFFFVYIEFILDCQKIQFKFEIFSPPSLVQIQCDNIWNYNDYCIFFQHKWYTYVIPKANFSVFQINKPFVQNVRIFFFLYNFMKTSKITEFFSLFSIFFLLSSSVSFNLLSISWFQFPLQLQII